MNPIKSNRLKKGYTQEDTARLLGISLRYYVDVENYNKCPNVYLALKLSKLLNSDPFNLFPIDKHRHNNSSARPKNALKSI